MIKQLLYYFCMIGVLHAEIVDSNSSVSNFTNTIAPSAIVEHNIQPPVGDDNVSTWNNSDWANKMRDTNGYGVTGNTEMFLQTNPFLKESSETTDTSKLTVDYFNNEDNASAAATGYSETFRSSLSGMATSNGEYTPFSDDSNNQLHCFMARDLPFRYRCTETGLVYGGDTLGTSSGGVITNMGGLSGKEALGLCKENCKQQATCVQVANGSNQNQIMVGEGFNFNNNSGDFSTTKIISNNEKNVLDFTFMINATEVDNNSSEPVDNPKIFFDFSYTDINDNNITLLSGVRTVDANSTQKLIINKKLKSIYFRVYSEDENVSVQGTISQMIVSYDKGDKFICPSLQDITITSNEFASSCSPSQETSLGGFTICSNGLHAGDNNDGSFSNIEACNQKCNIPKKCIVEYGTFDANIFRTIREGRIGGISADGADTDSTTDDMTMDVACTLARQNQEKIINEAIIDANGNSIQTVLDGALVPNVQRPRVMQQDSLLSFERKNQEEWKDKAYENMITSGTYTSSSGLLGAETTSHFAYMISMANGATFGYPGVTSRRELFAKIKPPSSFYDNGVQYKIYAVVKADIEKNIDDINGTDIVRDQIWYIKTTEEDTFKPFIRADNYATESAIDFGTSDSLQPTLSYNPSANFEYKTFNGVQWVSSASGFNAPAFASTTFVPDDFWYKFKITQNLGGLYAVLPGIAHSATFNSVGMPTYNYSGEFDGTGEGVTSLQIYVFISENSLSYSDLKNKIDAIDNSNEHQVDNSGAKIYETAEGYNYDKFIKSDGIQNDSGIQIFQYGPANKNSLKVIIKPKAEDIGKNAFIFIFIY